MTVYTVLGERDYKILATIYLMRICSLANIHSMYFSKSSRSATARRLQILTKSGYIDLLRLVRLDRSWINVYFLTKRGVNEARNWLQITHNRVVSEKFKRTLAPVMYEHDLLVTDVFVKLVQEKVLSVNDLFTGNFVDARLSSVKPSLFHKKKDLKPDAKFVLNGVNYWIEADRGSESIAKVKQKLKKYETYFNNNPGTRNTVLFLMGGAMNWKHFHEFRALSRDFIGPHNSIGKVNWYTCDINDLDFIVKQFMKPDFFTELLERLRELGCSGRSMYFQTQVFNHEFLPTAMMPAAWLGFRSKESEYEQFYVVECIFGGQSGALQRLKNFDDQASEFSKENKGSRKIKMILLILHEYDLSVITKLYPRILNNAIVVNIKDLLNGTCNAPIAREEEVK